MLSTSTDALECAVVSDVESAIREFLESGDYDPLFQSFPGDNHLERIVNGAQALTESLIEFVQSNKTDAPPCVPEDTRLLAREKARPMVCALFPKHEQEAVLSMLENSLVFVSSSNIESLIRENDLGSAWTIASLYLNRPVDSCQLVGLSIGTKCYVSKAYFESSNPLSDYVVHEMAHTFHNTKRDLLGLSVSSTEWLLPIAFSKRELFAYGCEAYSQLGKLENSEDKRKQVFTEHRDSFLPADQRVIADELFAILDRALNSENGWQKILAACSDDC